MYPSYRNEEANAMAEQDNDEKSLSDLVIAPDISMTRRKIFLAS